MQIEKITYAGHASVLLSAASRVIGIDPWLEGNPVCPAELQNPDKLDLIVLTHGHADHAGDTLRLAKLCGSAIAATFELAMILIDEGIPQEKVIPMNKGGTTTWEGYQISLTHALHSSSYTTAEGNLYAGEACGAVVSDGTRTFYHAGDTALFSDMSLIREQYRPDLAFIPFGDHFTMGPAEAARAIEFVGCKTVVPIHYRTFDVLTGTLEQLQEACTGLDVEIAALDPGQELKLA